MKLIIDNFAKIKKAEIVFDGITIIAGKNNSGKSTVGKVLYGIFNSLNGMEEKIQKKKQEEIEKSVSAIVTIIYVLFMEDKEAFKERERKQREPDIEKLVNEIKSKPDGYWNEKELFKLFADFFDVDDKLWKKTFIKEFLEENIQKILQLIGTSEYSISCEIINRIFCGLFCNQINSLVDSEDASLKLMIKDKKINILFQENHCNSYQAELKILKQAYYIENPLLINKLSANEKKSSENENTYIAADDNIISILSEQNNDILHGIFDSVIAKEKLSEIYNVLNDVIDGEISFDGSDFLLATKNFTEPLKINNLSAGLKSFVIIKMLLEKGALKEKDILILDEPEIHLHPEWQLKYAQMIVLLQKVFDLNIVVTTHSAHFLDAIDFYSKKYKIQEKCNYYLTNMQNGMSTFECVNRDLEKIYSQLVEPSILLDKLKYEQEMEDEDEE